MDSLAAAATLLMKAEQDTSGSSKDARPHCAARIALSKAVIPALPQMHSCWKTCCEVMTQPGQESIAKRHFLQKRLESPSLFNGTFRPAQDLSSLTELHGLLSIGQGPFLTTGLCLSAARRPSKGWTILWASKRDRYCVCTDCVDGVNRKHLGPSEERGQPAGRQSGTSGGLAARPLLRSTQTRSADIASLVHYASRHIRAPFRESGRGGMCSFSTLCT